MFCPNCGKENPSGQSFCSNCGASLNSTSGQTPPKSNKNFTIGLIIIIVLGLVFFNPIMVYLNTNYLGKPSLHVGEINAVPDLLSGGLVFTFQIYNSGNGAAKNIYATIGVMNETSRVYLTSKEVYVGNLDPGESKVITARLPYSGSYHNLRYGVSLPPMAFFH